MSVEKECIDLKDHQSEGVNIFSGREKGIKLREALKIDKLDHKRAMVTVIIPNDTIACNPSFLLGLLGKSVRKLGEVEFRNLYGFKCDDSHRSDIEEFIRRSLLTSDVLEEQK